LVRQIDAVLDLSRVSAELARDDPTLGRPSIDPVLMIRMLNIGHVFGLRCERLLCREVQVNLAYRWFCKLGIELAQARADLAHVTAAISVFEASGDAAGMAPTR